MNQLTTIAALPSGSGCAAALKPEAPPKPTPIYVYGTYRTADAGFARRAQAQGFPVKSIPGGWEIEAKGD